MGALLTLIVGACGVGSLICFILVLIQMFQNDQTATGIACIVLVFVCGIGGLVAFVSGWMNAGRWNIKNVMLAWTVCIVVGGLVQGVSLAMLGAVAGGGF